MAGVALRNKDTAGGTILTGTSHKGEIEGYSIAVVGDPVSSHGDSPHSNAKMIEGSSKFTIEGIPVVLKGHLASCGHKATSSSKMEVSS